MKVAAFVLAALLLGPAGVSAQDFHVGETARTIAPARTRDWRGARTHALVTRIWFPVDAATPERPHLIGASGHEIMVGAPIAQGPLAAARQRYPLLLLSHGTGGSADSLDWVGAGLARAGYIVVAVNHPGNNALEPYTPEGFLLWWERAADLSDALDAILADPKFAERVDRDRIGAVGFSLGGYTVLEVAGARTAPGAFQAFCASPEADAVCHPPEMAGISTDALAIAPGSETRASLARAGQSYRDPRVKAVFAIAPALGEAFASDSFAEVRIPVALVAGDADQVAPVGTNILRFARFIPTAEVTLVPGADHYTFLDLCTPAGDAQLPLLCRDDHDVDRAAVHALALDKARAFFARELGPGAPS
jgi:predicted dienelactone hydrolase